MDQSLNPVFQAIFQRRSIRSFTLDALSKDQMWLILQAGQWAPSGLNNQPWRFLPVWQGDPRQELLAECTKYARIIREAQALIVVFLDQDQVYSQIKDQQAVGACLQNMLLAAHSLGLGAVWLGEILNQEEQALRAMDVNGERYKLMAVLALGYPAQEGHSKRKPLSELLLEEM
ncbi:MAG: nitroreductase family protein [Desulfohalobiaceae bacterium]